MKHLFIIILVACCMSKISAQGNLQFNQVKIIYNTYPSQTVPAGKVWKIESFGGGNLNGQVSLNINGSNAGLLVSNYSSSANIAFNSCRLPMWFPTGTQIGFGSNEAGLIIWFSIIEFNVVP